MISPFYSSSRERARDYPFYRLRLLFTLKTTVSLFYKGKQSAWRWSEESSINTHEHNAGHSINETADHFIKHICLTFLDVGVTHQPTQQWSMTQWYEQIKVIGFGSYPLTSLFTPLHIFLNGCAPPDGQGPDCNLTTLLQLLLYHVGDETEIRWPLSGYPSLRYGSSSSPTATTSNSTRRRLRFDEKRAGPIHRISLHSMFFRNLFFMGLYDYPSRGHKRDCLS